MASTTGEPVFGGSGSTTDTTASRAVRKPIRNHTVPGEAIYEPFCGFGTILMAAEQTGRICFAMQIDPKYIDVTRKWRDSATDRSIVTPFAVAERKVTHLAQCHSITTELRFLENRYRASGWNSDSILLQR
jgi:hypothetical protein